MAGHRPAIHNEWLAKFVKDTSNLGYLFPLGVSDTPDTPQFQKRRIFGRRFPKRYPIFQTLREREREKESEIERES